MTVDAQHLVDMAKAGHRPRDLARSYVGAFPTDAAIDDAIERHDGVAVPVTGDAPGILVSFGVHVRTTYGYVDIPERSVGVSIESPKGQYAWHVCTVRELLNEVRTGLYQADLLEGFL